MTAIGIDYSSSKAYLAVTSSEQVLHIASLSLLDPKIFLQQYQHFLAAAWSTYDIKGDKIIIEDSWSREGRYAWTGIKLEHMKTLLQAGALLSKASEFRPQLVLPGVWRKAVLGQGMPKNAKEVAVQWVKENMGFDVPVMGSTGRGSKADHNFAEAICLAVYGNLPPEKLTYNPKEKKRVTRIGESR